MERSALWPPHLPQHAAVGSQLALQRLVAGLVIFRAVAGACGVYRVRSERASQQGWRPGSGRTIRQRGQQCAGRARIDSCSRPGPLYLTIEGVGVIRHVVGVVEMGRSGGAVIHGHGVRLDPVCKETRVRFIT